MRAKLIPRIQMSDLFFWVGKFSKRAAAAHQNIEPSPVLDGVIMDTNSNLSMASIGRLV